MCNLEPKWLPNNNWTHGFAFVEVYEDGMFAVQNHLVIAGKMV
jgi:hypothetical protein